MKLAFTSILFFFAMSAFAQDPMYAPTPSEKNLDTKYGFRDAKLETDLSQFSDLELVDEQGQTKFYTRASDELSVGEYAIEQIIYAFYKNKLQLISIRTKGSHNSRGLLQVLRSQYGYGSQPNRYMDKYIWSAKKTQLVYDENSLTNDADIIIVSKPLTRIRDKEEAEAAKKAAKADF